MYIYIYIFCGECVLVGLFYVIFRKNFWYFFFSFLWIIRRIFLFLVYTLLLFTDYWSNLKKRMIFSFVLENKIFFWRYPPTQFSNYMMRSWFIKTKQKSTSFKGCFHSIRQNSLCVIEKDARFFSGLIQLVRW